MSRAIVPSSRFRSISTSGAVRLGSLFWGLGGFLLAVVLLWDPLHWHSLDERLRGEAVAAGTVEGKQAYICPMHPEVVLDEEGSCPICGMDLVPVVSSESSASPSSKANPPTFNSSPADTAATHNHGEHDPLEVSLWTCSMHPEVLQREPGSCPVCGMDLVPVGGGTLEMSPEGGAPVVHLERSVIQSMNVRTELAQRRDLNRELRTVGHLEYDPQKMVTVTPKLSGWVEKVSVNYVGEKVRRGQPLFEMYAPELVQTQQELLSALEMVRSLGNANAAAQERAEGLVKAIRTRLELWDLDERQIRQLETSGSLQRRITVHAPAGGVVMKRIPSLEGMAISPGMELFHIADLSSLWLSVEIFEEQLPWIGEGSTAEVSLTHLPGEVFTGRVRFIEPQLNEETRTLGVKLEIPNRGGNLRAGMFATVVFHPAVAVDVVAVPAQAVLRTGERNLIVVALGEGRFMPKEVELGSEAEGFVEVRQGLEEGERVVTSAQFLIDSESNLRAAVQQLLGSDLVAAPDSRGEAQGSLEGAGHVH